jgi:hypothetical protein
MGFLPVSAQEKSSSTCQKKHRRCKIKGSKMLAANVLTLLNESHLMLNVHGKGSQNGA